MTPESKFKAKLVKALRAGGWMVQTIETTTGRGVPDLVILKECRTFWVEVKATESKSTTTLRPEQHTWIRKALLQGVFVGLCTHHTKTDEISYFEVDPECGQPFAKGWRYKVNPMDKFRSKDFLQVAGRYLRS